MKIGLGRLSLESKVVVMLEERKKRKSKLIPLVMISFMIGPWRRKIRRTVRRQMTRGTRMR